MGEGGEGKKERWGMGARRVVSWVLLRCTAAIGFVWAPMCVVRRLRLIEPRASLGCRRAACLAWFRWRSVGSAGPGAMAA